MLHKLNIKTHSKVELIDITSRIRELLKSEKIGNGSIQIHVPHTTAAVTINENADSAVKEDIIKEINKIIPFSDNYSHREGNSAAHLKSSLFGVDQNLLIDNNELVLGTWQAVCFCEFDGPRTRNIYIKFKKD